MIGAVGPAFCLIIFSKFLCCISLDRRYLLYHHLMVIHKSIARMIAERISQIPTSVPDVSDTLSKPKFVIATSSWLSTSFFTFGLHILQVY